MSTEMSISLYQNGSIRPIFLVNLQSIPETSRVGNFVKLIAGFLPHKVILSAQSQQRNTEYHIKKHFSR